MHALLQTLLARRLQAYDPQQEHAISFPRFKANSSGWTNTLHARAVNRWGAAALDELASICWPRWSGNHSSFGVATPWVEMAVAKPCGCEELVSKPCQPEHSH